MNEESCPEVFTDPTFMSWPYRAILGEGMT